MNLPTPSVPLCRPRLVLISFNEAQISSAIFVISSAVATSCSSGVTNSSSCCWLLTKKSEIKFKGKLTPPKTHPPKE